MLPEELVEKLPRLSHATDPDNEEAERIRRVASFADEYIDQLLESRWNPATLPANWWQALLFWFSHSFYQGRRDDVSGMFEQRALGVIEDTLGATDLAALKSLARSGLVEGGAFDERLRKAGVPKRFDRLMVMASLKLASELSDGNLVSYSLGRIAAGDLEDHYHELMELPSVGPKISSFYLRDLDLMFDLSDHISESGYLSMQPIDVWVGRLASTMGIASTYENTHRNRRQIVRACLRAGVDPNRFNVGAWWIGTRGIPIP